MAKSHHLQLQHKRQENFTHGKFLKNVYVYVKARKKVGNCISFCAKNSPYGSEYIYNAVEFASLQNLLETCNANLFCELMSTCTSIL